MLRIVVERGGDVVRDDVFDGTLIVAGRDASSDLVLDDPFVSARHLIIRHDAERNDYRLFDQSTNGIFWEEERVRTLRFDAPTSVRIADFRLTMIPVVRSGTAVSDVDLRSTTVNEPLPEEEPTAPHRKTEPGGRAVSEVEVRTISADGELRSLVFAGAIVIGRSPDCDLRFASRDISRRHCVITPSADGWILRRLAEKNPVYVNEREVASGATLVLRDGDVITVSDEEILFLDPATKSGLDSRLRLAHEGGPNVDLVVSRRSCAASGVGAFDLIGFLGSKTSPRFEEQMQRHLAVWPRMLLDLGYLVGLDAIGIATLVRLVREAEQKSVKLQFIRVTPRVADVLSATSLYPILRPHIAATEETAIRRLRD